jgi:hypothetical protein
LFSFGYLTDYELTELAVGPSELTESLLGLFSFLSARGKSFISSSAKGVWYLLFLYSAFLDMETLSSAVASDEQRGMTSEIYC